MEQKKKKKEKRNAELTKAIILVTASSVFSEKGFDGARVDAIAKLAGCNINLVYHYFKNKENLFVAVLEEAYRTIRHRQNDFGRDGADPETAMAELVRSTFSMFVESPGLIGLINSENIHEARHIRQSAHIREMYEPLIEFIRDTLDKGAAQGRFRDDIDPIELYISINAECYFHLSNRHTMGFILQRDMTDAEALEKRKAHVVDMILSYLSRPSPG